MNRKILNFEILQENLNQFKNKKICAMVKCDAYGHGTKEIVEFLKDKVDFFGVSSLSEAFDVKKLCKNNILIVSPIKEIEICRQNNFEFIVEDFSVLAKAKRLGVLNLVHIKLNVGMNRYGFACNDKKAMKRLRLELRGEKVAGICTHFPCLKDPKSTKQQYLLFNKIKKFLGVDSMVHFGGSGVINYKFDYDMIRVGIGLYLSEGRQVMQIVSKISKIIEIKTGRVGYDGKHEISSPSKIAVLPIGYGDGLLRCFSGQKVFVNNQPCKIVGRICMDCTFIDVTNVFCRVGDEVEILKDVQSLAKAGNTIPYEIFTNFSKLRT